MRKLTMAAFATGLAIALGTGMASAAQASSVIIVGPGQSIQAAINAARPVLQSGFVTYRVGGRGCPRRRLDGG